MGDIQWLVWDDWNLNHIRERRGVHPDAVEDVCFGNPIELTGRKGLIVLIGPERH